jgi:dipeptidyl aminopeptidase/acylaminoacyl peptidase
VRGPALAIIAAIVAAAGLALQGSSAVFPQLLTYSVDVPLPEAQPYDGGLCLASTDGSTAARVSAPRALRDAVWSPDGRRVAYVRPVSEEGRHVFVSNGDGGGERDLTRGYTNLNDDPAWSPDGRLLAFTASNRQGVPHIALAALDGSRPRPLALALTGNPGEPAWSTNGRQLAVIVRPRAAPGPGDLHLADVDTGASRLLATSAAEPTWSPDGSQIAYVGPGGVVIVSVNGGGLRTVAARARSPAWSPDGRMIAFVRDGDLLVVRPDGGGQRVVVPGPLPVRDPAWRPPADRAVGTDRPCIVEGSSQADVLRGTSTAEIIVGGSGSDTIFGGGGEDVVLGGSGHDFVSGEAGNDRLVGGSGRDRLYGGRGDDELFGRDAQADALDGGPGRDSAVFDSGVVGAEDRLRSLELLLGRP